MNFIVAVAQDIEVGPVRVDTGNDWMDLGFVLILVIVIGTLFYKYWNRP